ncbi:MAG: hypothetical protein A2Y23_15375 [Clostridiales bacterium GWB2_37_7]|nr:MAG: hypothetical protein A2Y23_15375 [Clostridiales bacterium GWB2_37_7]
MFSNEKYLNKPNWKQKILYILEHLHFSLREVAYVLDLDEDELENFMSLGDEHSVINSYGLVGSRLYMLHILLTYLIFTGNCDDVNISELWHERAPYISLYKKPPWFEDGLRIYLINNRYNGLFECVKWIRNH